MRTKVKSVRQSVSLPAPVARRVRSLARARRVSANRAMVDLVESGLAARERERTAFLDLADQLARAREPAEIARLKAQLAKLTFGV